MPLSIMAGSAGLAVRGSIIVSERVLVLRVAGGMEEGADTGRGVSWQQ